MKVIITREIAYCTFRLSLVKLITVQYVPIATKSIVEVVLSHFRQCMF